MRFFREDEIMVLEALRRLVAKKIKPRAKQLDRTGEFPWETVNLLAENGFLSPLLPQRYGGQEISIPLFVRLIEEIAKACASSALLLMAQADGMIPIMKGGSEPLKKRFLSRLADATVLVAFAATEPQAGSDILSMKTRAVRKGDHYLINGSKCFITNGEVADFFTLYAYTDPAQGSKGISAFVVEKDTPGLSFGAKENKMGMRGSINSTLFFEDMEVPAENLISEEGHGTANMLAAIDCSRLFSAAQAVGIADGAFHEAREYTQQRVQFGGPISKLPVVRHMFADMATHIESARLLTYAAAACYEEHDPNFTRRAAMAKVLASDTAMQVTTDAVQLLGGYGYSRDYPVERMMRDAKLTQIYTGTNQILRHVIGRELFR